MKNSKTLVLLLLAAGIAAAGCSPEAEKAYLPPFKASKKVVDDSTAQSFNPMVDILFVIDNSGSMDTHQANLANNINQFISVFIQNSILDYNISVISTDNDNTSSPCCGRFYGSPDKIVTKKTPNRELILDRLLRIGTRGSGSEVPFDTTVAATTPQLLATWNVDFLRDDASLIVIFITDADDQSRVSSMGLYSHLLALKKGDQKKILAF